MGLVCQELEPNPGTFVDNCPRAGAPRSCGVDKGLHDRAPAPART